MRTLRRLRQRATWPVYKDNGTLSLSRLVDYTTSADVSSLFGLSRNSSKPSILSSAISPSYWRTSSPLEGIDMRARQQAQRIGRHSEPVLKPCEHLYSASARQQSVCSSTCKSKGCRFTSLGPSSSLLVVHHSSGPNRLALATFPKGLSVEVTHIWRANTAGKRMPRSKFIIGLTTCADGRDLPHPSVVPLYGARPKDIEFFLKVGLHHRRPQIPAKPDLGKRRKKRRRRQRPKGAMSVSLTSSVSVRSYSRFVRCVWTI